MINRKIVSEAINNTWSITAIAGNTEAGCFSTATQPVTPGWRFHQDIAI